MKVNNFSELAAFAFGYYDGKAIGVENNQFTSDQERHLYKLGYERGVSDYCEEADNAPR